MLVPPPTPFLPIILNKSISDSSKFFTKKLKSRKITNLRKAEKKTVPSKLKLTNRLRNKTRENETCSLDAKLHTPTSSYAISPDHPQRMHLGFLRILQQKNKRKMKPGRAKSITFPKDREFPKTFKQLQILLVTIRIKLLQLPTERPRDFSGTSK